MGASQPRNAILRTLRLLVTFVAVFALVRFLPPAAFWIAGGLVVILCGVYAGLETRREMKR